MKRYWFPSQLEGVRSCCAKSKEMGILFASHCPWGANDFNNYSSSFLSNFIYPTLFEFCFNFVYDMPKNTMPWYIAKNTNYYSNSLVNWNLYCTEPVKWNKLQSVANVRISLNWIGYWISVPVYYIVVRWIWRHELYRAITISLQDVASRNKLNNSELEFRVDLLK